MNLQIKQLNKSTQADFETLFQSKGGPSYCWCMAWRMTKEELKQNNPVNRKLFLSQRIASDTPVGLLAYDDEDPVAWCSIAPRGSFRGLGGDEQLQNVWSITCFYVKKEYRKKGITRLFIEHAKKYAAESGADYLEAYPVMPDSPSYRHMGFIKLFERAGFHFVKKAGSRRHVMTLKLNLTGA